MCDMLTRMLLDGDYREVYIASDCFTGLSKVVVSV